MEGAIFRNSGQARKTLGSSYLRRNNSCTEYLIYAMILFTAWSAPFYLFIVYFNIKPLLISLWIF